MGEYKRKHCDNVAKLKRHSADSRELVTITSTYTQKERVYGMKRIKYNVILERRTNGLYFLELRISYHRTSLSLTCSRADAKIETNRCLAKTFPVRPSTALQSDVHCRAAAGETRAYFVIFGFFFVPRFILAAIRHCLRTRIIIIIINIVIRTTILFSSFVRRYETLLRWRG